MSKLTERLDKLTEFNTKRDNIKARAIGLQAEQQAIDLEFGAWMKAEFGLEGTRDLSEILKKALEMTIEPKITP